MVPGVRALLSELSTEVDRLEASARSGEASRWEDVVAPLEAVGDRLSRVWGAVSHLKGVKDSAALREAVEAVQPERVAFGLRLSQSKPIYEALKRVQEAERAKAGSAADEATDVLRDPPLVSPETHRLTPAGLARARARALSNEIRDFELSGVALEGEARERYAAIQQELSTLSLSFSNHVLDATKAYRRLVADPAQVAGLPKPTLLAAAAEAKKDYEAWTKASKKEEEGKKEAGTEANGGAEANGDATAPGDAAAPGGAADALPAETSAYFASLARSSSSPPSFTAEEGPWTLTLDGPCFVSIMSHCRDRGVREHAYRAYVTRASSGELDNLPILERILALRREKAKLLGFETYADVSLAAKMATRESAAALLERLRAASRPAAERDLEEIAEFAREKHGFDSPLRPWDVSFFAERLKEARYSISDEELRPYFALPAVLEGLFGLAKRLFDADVEELPRGFAQVWHDDVKVFRVARGGQTVAYFYLDAYARPAEKRGGAWMDEVCGRARVPAGAPGGGGAESGAQDPSSPPSSRLRLPIAQVVCNQTPPSADGPSLMTFSEVETLFHEFGHAAQHMLTAQEEGLVSGIQGVEWDAVELPSQFLENWCYDRHTLAKLAKHHATGQPLPDELYDRLVAARNYRAGSLSARQLHFAILDLELHSTYDGHDAQQQPTATTTDDSNQTQTQQEHRTDDRERSDESGAPLRGALRVDREVARRTVVMQPLPSDRFLCAFSHIFAGGYAAGYFSYKWAEVLSADAFGAFEEAGLDDDDAVRATGRRFADTVLALGGGDDPASVFKTFRGRDPTVDALLRQSGLVERSATQQAA